MVCLLEFWIDGKRFFVPREGILVAILIFGDDPHDVGRIITLGLQSEHDHCISDRAIVISQKRLSQSSIEVGAGIIRLDVYRKVVLFDRFLIVFSAVKFSCFVVMGLCVRIDYRTILARSQVDHHFDVIRRNGLSWLKLVTQSHETEVLSITLASDRIRLTRFRHTDFSFISIIGQFPLTTLGGRLNKLCIIKVYLSSELIQTSLSSNTQGVAIREKTISF